MMNEKNCEKLTDIFLVVCGLGLLSIVLNILHMLAFGRFFTPFGELFIGVIAVISVGIAIMVIVAGLSHEQDDEKE